MSEPTTVPDDVAEACADALLAACARQFEIAGSSPTIDDCRRLAVATLETVIVRTLREGGRERG